MSIIEITSLEAEELTPYVRMTEAQLRNRLEPEKGIFIAESTKVIKTALENGCIPLSVLSERKHLDGQVKEITERAGDIPVYTADSDVLCNLTGFSLSRGIVCAMKRPAPRTPVEVCRGASRIAVLEGVVDSTNIGAIFRSAAALGMDGILLTTTCCDPLCRRAVRVSMGTVFQIPWAYIGKDAADWHINGIRQLHDLGFSAAAMALRKDSVTPENAGLQAEPRLAIIMGTEGDGLAANTIAECDYTVCIPMKHGVDSLNVAAASAVAFWALRRKDE